MCDFAADAKAAEELMVGRTLTVVILSVLALASLQLVLLRRRAVRRRRRRAGSSGIA